MEDTLRIYQKSMYESIFPDAERKSLDAPVLNMTS